MSNHSFDDAVSLRLDGTAAANNENGILINSLTPADFKEYRQVEPLRGFGEPKSMAGILPDSIIGIHEPFHGGGETLPHLTPVRGEVPIYKLPTVTGFPGIETPRGYQPGRYPLPEMPGQFGAETPLEKLNQRIVQSAVEKVQQSMTPAEKETLNKDAEKYAQEMRHYKEQMDEAMTQDYFRRSADSWPKPPAEPQSLIKYEAAVDKEIERIGKQLTA